MDEIKDILLKLHYLHLEVHEMYDVFKKSYHDNIMDMKQLKNALKAKMALFELLETSKIKKDLLASGTKYVTILDEDYPESLDHIYMPPLVLFYQGDASLFHSPLLAVIGSRKNSNYGEKVTRMIVKELVNNKINVISGLAYGIDSLAHRCALENKGRTVSVLGSGFNQIYPKENEALAREIASRDLLVSEYPPDEGPEKSHFPFRNRIVSGLSRGVLVIEAKEKSGTLITSDYALEQGKEVFAIVHDIFAENGKGTNHLLKQGAKPVTDINDILETFKF